MSKPIFKSNRASFLSQNETFVDVLKGYMAMDIEVGIKTTAGTPVKTGDMKAETRHFKTDKGTYRVESVKEYTAVQERGQRLTGPGAPTKQFENYTTPGTDAGWFQRSIDGVWGNRESYIDMAAKAAGLR